MLLAFAVAAICAAQDFTPRQEGLLNAIIQVESNGNEAAVGDGGNAIGCLQIWDVYWIDATEFDRTIGGEYRDCYKRGYAERVFHAYMSRYAREAWTDPRKFDPEKVARIHNGGPRGHTKEATLKYWAKVKQRFEEMSRQAPDATCIVANIPRYHGINYYRESITMR